jgi:hypothetical protein
LSGPIDISNIARPTAATFARDLDVDLIALVDRLSRRLRTAHRVCRTVTLRLRFDDLSCPR